MSDVLFQQLSTVQSSLQPSPPTIASAAVISPQNLVTFVTGTVAISTINPPVSGAHMLVLIFTNASPAVMLTTGNVKVATAPVQNVPVLFFYDPVTALYWSGRVAT